MAAKAKKETVEAAEPKVDAKEVLRQIGATFREEAARKSGKGKSTPRCDQEVHQLKATWMNRNIKNMDTRIDAYHWYHIKENDGEILSQEDIRVVLDAYDA